MPRTAHNAAQAQRIRTEAHRAITELGAQIAVAQQTVSRLTASASAAEQQYTAQLAHQKQARQAAARAAADLTRADAAYKRTDHAFTTMLVADYETDNEPGSITSSTVATLLTASDPATALDTAALRSQIAAQQASVVTNAQRAVAARQDAERARAAALARVAAGTRRLAALSAMSARALAQANATVTRLQSETAEAHYSQHQAVRLLSTFLGGWQTADRSTATQLDQHYSKIARATQHKPLPKATGAWTPAVGQAVAYRVIQWIGTPYAWAGGTPSGPSQGICTSDGAQNDCHVTGFDCSGLALYAWAPYLSMTHTAATQYGYGTVHPSLAQLRPGDLTFWSSDGTVAGIHHVAIYVGNGLVVQAPQSGDIVRITPLADVDSGYFDATRPLT